MKYPIDPEFRRIARKIPYHKAIIQCANPFLAIAVGLTRVPKGLMHKTLTLEGYQGLPFRTEVFEPAGEGKKLPCLIYVHGGAFSYKASVYHKKLACMYAEKANCRVYFPDYHLAPRYPYPTAYQDVLALYQYVMKNAEELGVDPEKIGVAGDSAGASIAALICNRYEQEGLERPCMQMLVYPLTDAAMQTDSMKRFSDTSLWNAKNNKRMWSYYCGKGKTAAAYAASPMHSPLPRVIPDAYLETAEYDCLHDEGVLYGNKLQEAGARVEIHEIKGAIHGYDSALNSNAAIRSVEKRILFLRDGFYGRSDCPESAERL